MRKNSQGRRKKVGKLTPKQRKFLAGKLGGKSDRQAALDAGYAESVADNAKQKILQSPAIAEKITEIMERVGIRDQLLMERLKEGLDALETKFFQFEGKVVESKDLIAWSERRAYLELALRLKGHLTNKHEISGELTLPELVARATGED